MKTFIISLTHVIVNNPKCICNAMEEEEEETKSVSLQKGKKEKRFDMKKKGIPK